jgi:hypothetical protein
MRGAASAKPIAQETITPPCPRVRRRTLIFSKKSYPPSTPTPTTTASKKHAGLSPEAATHSQLLGRSHPVDERAHALTDGKHHLD